MSARYYAHCRHCLSAGCVHCEKPAMAERTPRRDPEAQRYRMLLLVDRTEVRQPVNGAPLNPGHSKQENNCANLRRSFSTENDRLWKAVLR